MACIVVEDDHEASYACMCVCVVSSMCPPRQEVVGNLSMRNTPAGVHIVTPITNISGGPNALGVIPALRVQDFGRGDYLETEECSSDISQRKPATKEAQHVAAGGAL